MLKRFIALGWLLAALTIALSCGPSPMGETPTAWECRLEIPRDYAYARGFTICEGDIYLNAYIPQGDSRDVILKYDGRNLSISYDPGRMLGGTASVFDVKSTGGEVWACGLLYPEEGVPEREVFLVKREAGCWRVVFRSSSFDGQITRVFPIDTGSSWLLIDRDNGESVLSLALYANGHITEYPAAGRFEKLFYDAASGCLFGIAGLTCAISNDGGLSWRCEDIDTNAFGYIFERILGGSAHGDTLYLTARYQGMVYGILERRGGTGKGEYRPVFLEVNDPVFLELNAIAFDDRGRGIAAGHNSSAVYENGTWRKETMEEEVNFLELVADPRGGFWGISSNIIEGPQGIHLYYHP